MDHAAEIVMKARAGLVLDQPFFASIALRLPMVEDPKCETLYTDGKVIGYNPEFVKKNSLSHLKGILAHEVMHIVGCHHLRRGNRDGDKWNMACDYAINDILLNASIDLPKNALKGMGTDKSAEQIYNMLPDQKGDGKGNKDNKQQEDGQEEGQGGGEDSNDDSQQHGDPGGCGEVRDMPGEGGVASEAELSKAEAEVKVMVAQAAQQAKAQGCLPADLARLVDEMIEPKVSWQDVLRRFVQTSAKNDYKMMPPNKRYIHCGLYLPSLRSDELPEIIIVVDTSSSIGSEELNQFAAEVSSVLDNFNTTIHVVYCDSEVAGVEQFTSQDLPLKLHPKGGGGTDFRPPFLWAEEQGITPACVIYLTDLCGTFPKEEPEYPVLWAVLGDSCQKVPFGELIEISQ